MSHDCGAGSSPYFDASSTSRSSASVWCGIGAGRGRCGGRAVGGRQLLHVGERRARSMSPSACLAAAIARLASGVAARVGVAGGCGAAGVAAAQVRTGRAASTSRFRSDSLRHGAHVVAADHSQASRAVGARRAKRACEPIAQGNAPSRIRLGVERGHAAGARRRDGLPVHVVGDVARGEHAGHGRRGRVAFRAALHLDVAAGHVELALEDLRVRRVADRDEHAVHGDVLRRARLAST